MKEQEIVRMIRDVLTTTEMVVKQLRAEKKATGDYSKVVIVPYGDMVMRFEREGGCLLPRRAIKM